MLKLVSLKLINDLIQYLKTFKYETISLSINGISDINNKKENIYYNDINKFLTYYNQYFTENKANYCIITNPYYLNNINLINSSYSTDINFYIYNFISNINITYTYNYHIKLDSTTLKKIESQILWLTNLSKIYTSHYNILTNISELDKIYSLCYAEKNWSEEYIYLSQLDIYIKSKNIFM